MMRGILFDKDGTLFDFQRSWGGWAHDTLHDLAGGDVRIARTLAGLVGYNIDNLMFSPDSPVIAGTLTDVAEALLPALPGADVATLERRMAELAAVAAMVPVLPLAPFFDGLRARGLTVGIATNDAEEAARTQLEVAGIIDKIHFIYGYDSGHGGKPGPGMCLAFARAAELPPDACVMVGDSTHDLLAGRAAGMRTVAVLTGLAPAEVLAPLADVVLPDIGDLPDWLASCG